MPVLARRALPVVGLTGVLPRKNVGAGNFGRRQGCPGWLTGARPPRLVSETGDSKSAKLCKQQARQVTLTNHSAL
jgi:hypothetical protein